MFLDSLCLFHISVSWVCYCKILLTVLWDTSSLQFSLPRHRHNVCSFNLLAWSWRDNSRKALNLVSMVDEVKLSTRMRRLSPLSGCSCVIEHFHAERGHYRLARFSAFRWDLNRYNYSWSEFTWESWQWRSTALSKKFVTEASRPED